MSETIQIFLISVITILTILLTIIGIQVVYILKEFRKSIEKVNKILDDAGKVSNSFVGSFSSLTGITAGLKTVLSLFGIFKKEKNERER